MTVYYSDSHVIIYHGDCRDILLTLDAGSVQCCVTSPPYFGLRDYGGGVWVGGDESCDHRIYLGGNGAASSKQVTSAGTQLYAYRDTCGKCGATRHDAQIGLESTPREYVAQMAGVFEQVRRVLREDATCWLNLGDSYASGGGVDTTAFERLHSWDGESRQKHGAKGRAPSAGLKPKDLIGIPWRVAFALQEAGWYLRSDIIWAKGNPMPESVTDRPTKAHEYLFLLAKAERYYYDADAIREAYSEKTEWTYAQPDKAARAGVTSNGTGASRLRTLPTASGRNKRSVWNVNTQP
jgi:DNA modification methylase